MKSMTIRINFEDGQKPGELTFGSIISGGKVTAIASYDLFETMKIAMDALEESYDDECIDTLDNIYKVSKKQQGHEMKPFKTKDILPPCIDDDDSQCWWFDADNDSWVLGVPLLMDFDDEATFERWTHWLPEDAICIPETAEKLYDILTTL